MFKKIIQWIQERLNKMISTSTVKQALKIDLALSQPMAIALQKWSAMYINQAEWLNESVKSLNLPAAIAAEISRAVTIEMQVSVTGSARADWLQLQLKNVVDNIRTYTEYGAAKGGLMIKPYINGANISVDFVQADQFYPVAFDTSGKMTACVFSDQKTIGQYFYTRLEFHTLANAGYRITNAAFRSTTKEMLGNQIELSMVDAWADLEPEAMILNVDRPLFAYFKMPTANNIDPTSPLGVSIYARAVELIEQADRQWSSLMWEFESGERAVYADTTAYGKDSNNKPVLPRGNKRLYRALDSVANIGANGKLFEEWSPEFRDASIKNGLDSILKKIEFNCGLAYGTLSDPEAVALTATEIKTSKQRTYATITDTQKSLEDALEGLIYAMDVWATLGNLAPQGKYSVVYEFDDSIVADHDTQFAQDTQAVGLGTMSKVEWRMRNYGEDEPTARKMIDMIALERQPMDLFATDGGV